MGILSPWLALTVLVLGALGTMLPLLPGLPLMALAIVFYGWWEGFEQINAFVIVVTLLLTAAGSLLDYISGSVAAKKIGASKWGVIGATLGAVLGIIALGPIGLIAGPFLGAFLGEILGGKEFEQASKVGLVSMLGTILGSLVKFIFALIILLMFVIKVFF